MSATFDTSLSTDKDWVRALIGDTDVSPATDAFLADETIEAILTKEMNVFMAASRAARMVYMQLTGGGGIEDRKVGETRIRYQAAQRFKQTADELKARGYTYAKPYSGGIYKADRDAFDVDKSKLKTDLRHNLGENPRAPAALDRSST